MIEITTTLGGLSSVVLQSNETAPSSAVVLCHGYGASGQDLVPLGRELITRPDLAAVRFVFPAAPTSLGNFGYGDARAWWEIDIQRYSSINLSDVESLQTIQREVPSGLSPARRKLFALVDELSRQSGLGVRRIVVGGFSQGAMLATDVALRLEERPAGLAIFSGALICAEEWAKRAPNRKTLPVFQAHGRQDTVLPFIGGENLRKLLTGAGLTVDYNPFDGGHEIPSAVLDEFAPFLSLAERGGAK